ncbi:MAG: hypothetical protein Q9208_007144 [Pyrenodesmia sp. 3 TL-2023]
MGMLYFPCFELYTDLYHSHSYYGSGLQMLQRTRLVFDASPVHTLVSSQARPGWSQQGLPLVIDAIHDLPAREELAPAQLYSTESGRLFHSGRIAIATVGLPARGKTLGVKTRVFHLGDYRRKNLRPGEGIPEDYFFVNGRLSNSLREEASPSSVLFRQKILKKCREDIYHFLNHENGQIAIYDAVNPTAAGRRSLAKEFGKHDVEVSLRISDEDVLFVVVDDSYKTDASLSDQGRLYAEKMGHALLKHREGERQALVDRGGADMPLKPLKVWTSTRRRTVETADWLYEQGYSVRQRTQLSALNPGVCEKMSEKRIRAELPDEVAKHEADPYHHRYPRAESYHDLAVRLEPIILELERQQDDLLIIAHESVLRVLYGYLMACNAADIPSLSFPRNEIIEIIPASYHNEATSIPIPDLPPEIIPPSPENLKIPVPPSEAPSGAATPMSLGSPNARPGTPRTGTSPLNETGNLQEAGEGSLLLVERALRD